MTMIKNLIDLDTSRYGYQTEIRINGQKIGNGICGIRIELTSMETPKIAFDYGSGYIDWSDVNQTERDSNQNTCNQQSALCSMVSGILKLHRKP